jgi:hypothetical protein
MIIFMCAISRLVFVYFLDAHSDAAAAFSTFITEVHQLVHKISVTVLRTDNDAINRSDLEYSFGYWVSLGFGVKGSEFRV